MSDSRMSLPAVRPIGVTGLFPMFRQSPPGMMEQTEMDQLTAASGAAFDRLFTQIMIVMVGSVVIGPGMPCQRSGWMRLLGLWWL